MTFPDENISNEKKDSFKFGKKVAEFIASEWFVGSTNNYSKRNKWIDNMREYARGEHDMSYFKKLLCGDLEEHSKFANVDFDKKIKVLPKFMNLLANNLNTDLFNPKVYAIDPTAMEKKKEVRAEKIGLMLAKKNETLELLKSLNPEIIAESQDVEDDLEEVDLNMSLFYKEPIEKAEELFIKAVLADNHYNRTKKRLTRDLVNTGFMGIRTWTNPTDGIKISYVDARDAVYGKTNDPYFSDCKYFGEVKRMSIADVLQYSQIDITRDDIEKMQSQFDYYKTDVLNDGKVDVCFFSFETYNEDIYKKKKYTKNGKEMFKLIKRKEFEPHPESESEKVVDVYPVWYQGIMILGGKNKLIAYEKVQNQPEYKGKVLPPFVFIAPEMDEDGKLHSMVERTLDIVKSLQFVEIKIQQLTAELRPNVIDINLDMMIENASNPKVKMSVKEQTALFLFKGIRYSKSQTSEGDPIYSKSIREEAPAINNSLERLGNEAARLLNQLRNILGYNEFTDGSTPHPKTLNKVAEIARLSSNLAIKHYIDASLEFDVMLWENITSRMNDLFKYSDVKHKYISMIGQDDIDQLETLKKRSSHYFGVFPEAVPSEEEVMQLNEHLNIALQEGTIDLEDISVLRRIKDIRTAELLFRVKRKKYIKQKEEKDMQKINANADANASAAQQAEQYKQQTAMMISELKLKEMEAESFYVLRKIQAQTEGQLMVDAQSFNGKQMIENMNTEQMLLREKYKKDRDEDTKMKSLNLSAKNQAKLNDQKKYGTNPVFDFVPYDPS